MVSIKSGDRSLYGTWGMRKIWGYDSVNGYPRTNNDIDTLLAYLPLDLGFTPTFFGENRSSWMYLDTNDIKISFGRVNASKNYDRLKIADTPQPVRIFYYEGSNYVRFFFDGRMYFGTWNGINYGDLQLEITFFDDGHIEVTPGTYQDSGTGVELYENGFLQESYDLSGSIVFEPDGSGGYDANLGFYAASDSNHDILVPDSDGRVVTHVDDNIGTLDDGWFKHVPVCDPADVSEPFARVGSGGSVRAVPMLADGDTGIRMENPSGNVREMATYNNQATETAGLPTHWQNEGRGVDAEDEGSADWASDMDTYEDLHRFNYTGSQYGYWDSVYKVFVDGSSSQTTRPIYNVERVRVMFAANHVDHDTYENGDYALGVMDKNDNWTEDVARTNPTNDNKEVVIDHTFGSPFDLLGVAIYPIANVSTQPPIYFDFEPGEDHRRFAALCQYDYTVDKI